MTICNKIFENITSPIFGSTNFSNFSPRSLTTLAQHLFSSGSGCKAFNEAETEVLDAANNGSTRTPQAGRCYNFDGVDDAVEVPYNLALNLASQFTIMFYVNDTKPSGNGCYFSRWESGTSDKEIVISNEIGLLSISLCSAADSSVAVRRYNSVNGQGFKHICISFDNSILKVYIDGLEQSLVSSTGTLPSSIKLSNSVSALGKITNNSTYSFKGDIYDFRQFNRALLPSEITSVVSDNSLINNGLVAHYKCDESDSSVAYDSSVNAHHGVIENATLASFHATNIAVKNSFQNQLGYSENSGVLIPRDESDITKDAQGNLLQYTGNVPLNCKLTASHCANFDGIDDYLVVPEILATDTVISYQGTSAPSLSAGRIEFNSAGTCYNVQLSNGSKYSFSEGGGSIIYDVSSNGYHATAINISEPSFWAQTQDNYHYNIANGFRLSGAVKIPAVENSANLAADGNLLTHLAGNYHNQAETRLQQYDTPEMHAADVNDFWFNGAVMNQKAAVDFTENNGDKIFASQDNPKKLFNILSLLEDASQAEQQQLTQYVRN